MKATFMWFVEMSYTAKGIYIYMGANLKGALTH